MIFICIRKDRWRTMRTPKEYTDNIKNGIITKQMLSDCIFSVSKNAKNWKEKSKRYKGFSNRMYSQRVHAERLSEKYYRKKRYLLSIVEPICIHRETVIKKSVIRYCDDQAEYWDCPEEFVNEGSFYRHNGCEKEEVYFGDIVKQETVYNFFLFYDLGCGHTFHDPMGFGLHTTKESYWKNPDLEIKDIDNLNTSGEDPENLISDEFVDEVIRMIKSGDYRLIESINGQESLAS